jgi:hypothetical protein
VQDDVLAKYPDRDVAVTVVWFNMVRTDARDRWPRDEIVDRRTRHYWDAGRLVGTALAGRPELAAWRPVAWDVWLLYPAGRPMTYTNSGTDVLASLPDLPRWVDARGLLMERRGFVVDTADGCRLICGRKDRLVVPTTVELSPLVETTATREVPGASILLQDVMLPAGRYHLPDWTAEPATVFTLPPDRAHGWRLPPWPTAPMTAEQIEALDAVPQLLRDQLRDAVLRTSVWSATLEGRPVAFAYAAHTTESWFDVSVETLEGARNRGLGRAAAMSLIVDRMLRGLRPMWCAVKSNEASHGLARRLGFEPVDLLWVLTRPA